MEEYGGGEFATISAGSQAESHEESQARWSPRKWRGVTAVPGCCRQDTTIPALHCTALHLVLVAPYAPTAGDHAPRVPRTSRHNTPQDITL